MPTNCPICGNAVDDDARFCNACGASLTARENYDRSTSPIVNPERTRPNLSSFDDFSEVDEYDEINSSATTFTIITIIFGALSVLASLGRFALDASQSIAPSRYSSFNLVGAAVAIFWAVVGVYSLQRARSLFLEKRRFQSASALAVGKFSAFFLIPLCAQQIFYVFIGVL